MGENFLNKRINFFIIASGVLLRTLHLLGCRSLWADEARLAVEIVNRSFHDILNHQFILGAVVQPPGFIFLQKMFATGLGGSEIALRMFPFLSGVAALFLFYRLARLYLPALVVPLALLLFALSDTLIYYSAELKQYSVDVFCALLILVMIEKIGSRELDIKTARCFGWTGALLMWVSYPVLFILAPAFLVMTFKFLIEKKQKEFQRLVVSALWWLISFILLYRGYLAQVSTYDLLLHVWRTNFIPQNILSADTLLWIHQLLLPTGAKLFSAPVIVFICVIAPLVCLGFTALYKCSKERGWTLALLLVILFALNYFKKYPVNDRVMLFLIPVMIILLARGLSVFLLNRRKFMVFAGCALSSFLVFQAVFVSARHALNGYEFQDNRQAVKTLAACYQNGDYLYLNSTAQFSFWYYAQRFGLSGKIVEWEKMGGADTEVLFRVGKIFDHTDRYDHVRFGALRYEEHTFDKAGRFKGVGYRQLEDTHLLFSGRDHWNWPAKRVWVLLSHMNTDDKQFVLKCFDQFGYSRENFDFLDVSLHLYSAP